MRLPLFWFFFILLLLQKNKQNKTKFKFSISSIYSSPPFFLFYKNLFFVFKKIDNRSFPTLQKRFLRREGKQTEKKKESSLLTINFYFCLPLKHTESRWMIFRLEEREGSHTLALSLSPVSSPETPP